MSKTMISLGLAMMLAVPVTVWAQEDVAPADADSSADSTAMDATEAEAVADDARSSEAPSGDSSTDTSSTDSSGSSDEASDSGTSYASSDDSSAYGSDDSSGGGSDDGEGLRFYVGAERAETTIDFSDESLEDRFGRDQLDGGSYLGRIGIRLAPGISIEGVGSFLPDDDKGGRDVEFTQIYGAYLVTTGTVMETVEVSGRVGYAVVRAENDAAEKEFDNVSYGVEVALPLKVLSDVLPDVRLVGGGTVYSQERQSRIYGWHYGLRYDFGF